MNDDLKQVTAIKYGDRLYATMADAEAARVRDGLLKLLPPIMKETIGGMHHAEELFRGRTLDELLKHPKELAAMFARLSAAQ